MVSPNAITTVVAELSTEDRTVYIRGGQLSKGVSPDTQTITRFSLRIMDQEGDEAVAGNLSASVDSNLAVLDWKSKRKILIRMKFLKSKGLLCIEQIINEVEIALEEHFNKDIPTEPGLIVN
jgi:hypothetical protein